MPLDDTESDLAFSDIGLTIDVIELVEYLVHLVYVSSAVYLL